MLVMNGKKYMKISMKHFIKLDKEKSPVSYVCNNMGLHVLLKSRSSAFCIRDVDAI